jgi:hypothetical protein
MTSDSDDLKQGFMGVKLHQRESMRCDALKARAGEIAFRRVLQIVGVNIFVLATGLAVLELSFGNWFGTNLTNIAGLICDKRFLYSGEKIYGAKKAITYSRDFQCLRGNYSPMAVDVITVGGSTTDQRYLSDGETWQDWIQKYYKQTGRHISIANAGLDGQTTIGHLSNFQFWFPHLRSQPTYYLFYLGINDLYRLAPAGDYDESVKRVKVYEGWEKLKMRSAVFNVYRNIKGFVSVKNMGVGHRRTRF